MTKDGMTILAAVLLTALSISPVAMAEAQRPNIILMIADDMSSKDWGIYGNTFVKTPNIDKAARDGIRFTNAYSPSTACHPARSALLTGQEIWRLRDAAVLLPGGRTSPPTNRANARKRVPMHPAVTYSFRVHA